MILKTFFIVMTADTVCAALLTLSHQMFAWFSPNHARFNNSSGGKHQVSSCLCACVDSGHTSTHAPIATVSLVTPVRKHVRRQLNGAGDFFTALNRVTFPCEADRLREQLWVQPQRKNCRLNEITIDSASWKWWNSLPIKTLTPHLN